MYLPKKNFLSDPKGPASKYYSWWFRNPAPIDKW